MRAVLFIFILGILCSSIIGAGQMSAYADKDDGGWIKKIIKADDKSFQKKLSDFFDFNKFKGFLNSIGWKNPIDRDDRERDDDHDDDNDKDNDHNDDGKDDDHNDDSKDDDDHDDDHDGDGKEDNDHDDDHDGDDDDHDQSMIKHATVGFGLGIRELDIDGGPAFQNVINECIFHSAESFGHDDGKDDDHVQNIINHYGNDDDNDDAGKDDDDDGDDDKQTCIRCLFLNQDGNIIAKGEKDLQSYIPSQKISIEMFSVPEVEPGAVSSNDFQDVKTLRLEICGPPKKAEGCTPGFWKQQQHFGSWPTEYKTFTEFGDVFSTPSTLKIKSGNNEIFLDTATLLEALNAQGGGVNALARHAVAALLNAASNANYAFTVDQVKTMVNQALASNDPAKIEDTKDKLAQANEQGCQLCKDERDQKDDHKKNYDDFKKYYDDNKKKFNKGDYKKHLDSFKKYFDDNKKDFDKSDFKQYMDYYKKYLDDNQKHFDKGDYKKYSDDYNKYSNEYPKHDDENECEDDKDECDCDDRKGEHKKYYNDHKKYYDDNKKKFSTSDYKQYMDEHKKFLNDNGKYMDKSDYKEHTDYFKKFLEDNKKNFSSSDYKKYSDEHKKYSDDYKNHDDKCKCDDGKQGY